MPPNFAGKVALITGASSGIGAATAELFARCGAALCLTGRNLDNLEATASKCKSASNKEPLLIQAELTREGDVETLVRGAIAKYGKLDILVNNAGVLEMGSIENTSLEQYDRVMNVNVRSIYNLTMLCVPYLIESKGSVVNISSVNGIRSFPNVLAYNVSKAALDQFTRCVALELASKGVRVNSVNPGVTVTDLHKTSGMDADTYAKFLERSKETHAMGRPGQVDEVASAIAYLASAESSFVTGASIPVDGGRHAMCPR